MITPKNMKKFIFIQIVLLTIGIQVYAQQEAMYSQYMFNTLVINPAYAGSRETISLVGLYRDQWVNIEGAPKTATFSFDMPVSKSRIGLGLMVVNDRIGIFNTTSLYASYAFRIIMRRSVLAMGLQAGFTKYLADFRTVSLNPDNTYDAAYAQKLDAFKPNFGAGIFFNSEKFYAGLSVPALINKQIINANIITGDVTFQQFDHIFLTSGYVFDITPQMKLKPSVLLKYASGSPLELDVNINAWFFDIFAIGASYRTGDSFLGMVEIKPWKQLHIGYAYDYTVTDLGKYNKGTHEIMLRYEFSTGKSRILTPRYF